MACRAAGRFDRFEPKLREVLNKYFPLQDVDVLLAIWGIFGKSLFSITTKIQVTWNVVIMVRGFIEVALDRHIFIIFLKPFSGSRLQYKNVTQNTSQMLMNIVKRPTILRRIYLKKHSIILRVSTYRSYARVCVIAILQRHCKI